MALQGTLDTFALPDVLRLLAATRKTGRLRITGARGAGSVWVSGGEICATEATHAPHATQPVDALVELLRFEEGSFAFDADVAPNGPGAPTDVEALLADADALLQEWREIEQVVPSLDAYVTLRRSLDEPSITIAQEHWGVLVAVGGGSTVRRMGDDLCLPEIPVSRAVRDLAALGVIDIAAAAPPGLADPPAIVAAAADDEPSVEIDVDAGGAEPEAVEPAAPPADDPDALPVARPLRARRTKTSAPTDDGPRMPEHFVPLELPGHMASSPGAATALSTENASEGAGDDGLADLAIDDLAAAFPGLVNRMSPSNPEDNELARQLATLSPRAAEAVRAAAEAATDEERSAVLDEADAGEDAPINRGLLLKFLSSVKS